MNTWAKIRCDAWFYLGVFADRVLVQPIPNAVWRLQCPGAWLYQKCMARSYLLNERYGLDRWQPSQT
jgi:hypothetical protein